MDVDLAKMAEIDEALKDEETAHIMIDRNRVISRRDVKGLVVETHEREDGVDVKLKVLKGSVIKKPVHMCFGITHEKTMQRIKMDIEIEDGAQASFLSHCILPKSGVRHEMEAAIYIGENAKYSYEEKHIHAFDAKVEVVSKAKVRVGKKGVFKTDFELIRGRVGILEIDYEAAGDEKSIIEMTTRVSGREDDIIKVKETGYLKGEGAKGALATRIAVRQRARAEIYNKMVATAAYARGHVDCKEIIQDKGEAMAIPVVEVKHPRAHVTHEAAIGSVDKKQLETLMARGLSEDEAVELIIEGMLGA